MKVSIVIPNWNGEDKLKRNLPLVLKVKGIDEVIVCDDGSTDNSVSLIKENFPQVKVVIREKNSGFSSAVNDGVRKASGELVFLLNSDAVPEEDSLVKAVNQFSDPKVFSVSCNVRGSWSWAKFNRGYYWHYQAKNMPQGNHETLWASGGSGIFRKRVWDQLGGLDELFNPFYEEDIDLGYRAVKSGFINIWVKDSKAEHYKQKGVIEENFSKSKIAGIAQRNQLLFIWKNITDTNYLKSHILNLFINCITHPKYIAVFFAALTKLPQVIEKRREAKKYFQLPDREIFEKYHQ